MILGGGWYWSQVNSCWTVTARDLIFLAYAEFLAVSSVIWLRRVVIFCLMQKRPTSNLSYISTSGFKTVSLSGEVSVMVKGASGDDSGWSCLAGEIVLG